MPNRQTVGRTDEWRLALCRVLDERYEGRSKSRSRISVAKALIM